MTPFAISFIRAMVIYEIANFNNELSSIHPSVILIRYDKTEKKVRYYNQGFSRLKKKKREEAG